MPFSNLEIPKTILGHLQQADGTAIESLGYTRVEFLQIGMQLIDATFTSEMIAAAFESIRNSKEKQTAVPTHIQKERWYNIRRGGLFEGV